MRTVLSTAAAALCLATASVASAQTPPPQNPQNNDRRIESAPAGDLLSRTPQSQPSADGSKGDGLTTGKDGDPIGATNDDKGRQGEAHSDPTLATKPAPPSDPKSQ
jgi:hypothetical protein